MQSGIEILSPENRIMTTEQLEQAMKDAEKQIAEALDAAHVKGNAVTATAMHHLAIGVLLGIIGPTKTREMMQITLATIDETYGAEMELSAIFARMRPDTIH